MKHIKAINEFFGNIGLHASVDTWVKKIEKQIEEQKAKGEEWLIVSISSMGIGPMIGTSLPNREKFIGNVVAKLQSKGYSVQPKSGGGPSGRWSEWLEVKWGKSNPSYKPTVELEKNCKNCGGNSYTLQDSNKYGVRKYKCKYCGTTSEGESKGFNQNRLNKIHASKSGKSGFNQNRLNKINASKRK